MIQKAALHVSERSALSHRRVGSLRRRGRKPDTRLCGIDVGANWLSCRSGGGGVKSAGHTCPVVQYSTEAYHVGVIGEDAPSVDIAAWVQHCCHHRGSFTAPPDVAADTGPGRPWRNLWDRTDDHARRSSSKSEWDIRPDACRSRCFS